MVHSQWWGSWFIT